MNKRKVIITCAITGNAPFNPNHPSFPVTPNEIAASVQEAADAGAAIAHIHVRNPKTGEGSRDRALFLEVVRLIREQKTNILINLTAGLGGHFLPDPNNEGQAMPGSDIAGPEERVLHLRDCQPDIASLDVTTGNQVEGDMEFVYLNTTRTLRAMARDFQSLSIKAEIEAFQAGDVLFAKELISEGLINNKAMIQFVLGVKWGAPADTETVLYMKNLLRDVNCEWTAMGIGRDQFPMAAQSILLGGHVRVGLEDNLYLDKGIFASNGQLVARAKNLVYELGCDIASADDARSILEL